MGRNRQFSVNKFAHASNYPVTQAHVLNIVKVAGRVAEVTGEWCSHCRNRLHEVITRRLAESL